MSAGTVIGNAPCICGTTLSIQEGKGGTLSAYCSTCRGQVLQKSPAGVALWLKKLAPSPAPTAANDPTPAPAGGKKTVRNFFNV